MHELTDAEYEIVCRLIEEQISNKQLQLELIDHCCCLLETSLDEKSNFMEALTRSVSVLSQGELGSIEVELNHVLQSKTQKTMKRLLYVFGFLATFLTMAGQTMKMMQWPFANYTQIAGASALVLAMLVLIANVASNPEQYKRADKMRVLTGAIGGLILGLGVSFKILHVPSAGVLFVSGMAILTFVFVPMFFWHLYKRELA